MRRNLIYIVIKWTVKCQNLLGNSKQFALKFSLPYNEKEAKRLTQMPTRSTKESFISWLSLL